MDQSTAKVPKALAVVQWGVSQQVMVRERGLLCAGLLAAGRPLSVKELSTLLNLEQSAVAETVDDLQRTLRAQNLGVVVEEVADGYRLIADLASSMSNLGASDTRQPARHENQRGA